MSTGTPALWAECLAANAARLAEVPAIVDGSETVSHALLWRRVRNLAARLRPFRRRRVVLLATSGHELVTAHYALWIAGAETMLLDAGLADGDRHDLLDRFEPELLVATAKAVSGSDGLAADLASAPAAWVLTPEGSPVGTPVDWDSEPSGEAATPEAVAADDVVLVLNTTGTTGRPKLVALTSRNLLAAARAINRRMELPAGSREVCPLPLQRSFGLGRARCLALAGGTLILSPPRGDQTLALVRRHAADGLSSVPAFLRLLVQTFGDRLSRYLETIRYVEIGSAPMSRQERERLLELLPEARLYLHYGLTEASRSAFLEFRSERHALDTVGQPAPGVEIEIRDENDRACPAGEAGEITIRGEHVLAAYWGDADLTAKRLRGGWLHTNDRGRWNAAGYLEFLGRLDDVINVGGHKVAPEVIERVAGEIPGVRECAAVGETDPQGVYGEVPVLFVVAEPGAEISADRIREFCRERLSPECLPREVRFVGSMPRTDTGKLQRQRLRGMNADAAEERAG